jgi:putative Ca2+/H+ antiporter (TMEM165/GDT1 family)
LADLYAARYGRPGVVTAIGVASIIVASLSLLANLGLGFQAMVLYSTSRMIAAVPASPPAPGGEGSATLIVGDEFLTPAGLPAAQRRMLIEVLAAKQPLSEPRRAQLEAMLVDSGRIVLPADVPQTRQADVRRLVAGSGRLPSLDGKPGRVFYDLSTGRLEIDDDSAVFFPADGSPAVRTTGPVAVAVPNGSTVLSPAQVQAAVEQVQTLSGAPLTQPQREALASALRQPWQQLIRPSASVTGIRSQFRSAVRQVDGSIIVQTSMATCTLLPQGAVQMNGAYVATATGTPVAAVSGRSVTAALADAFVSLALAAALLVFGILALRQSRRMGRWLKIWAVVKLAAAIGTAMAWGWFYREMLVAWHAGRGDSAAVATGIGIALGSAAALWPAILLILLHTRGAREYYAREADARA